MPLFSSKQKRSLARPFLFAPDEKSIFTSHTTPQSFGNTLYGHHKKNLYLNPMARPTFFSALSHNPLTKILNG